MVSQEKAALAAKLAEDLGYDIAAEKMGVSKPTLRRYVSMFRKANEDSSPAFDQRIMRQVRERFTDDELKKMLKGSNLEPNRDMIKHSFDGEVVTIGAFTDTHLGSKYTDPDMIYRMFDVFAKEKIDHMMIAGDIFEGVSHRAGHMYECTHLGYSAQLEHGREVFGQWTDTEIDAIDGNHDRWLIKSSGALIVKELARSLDNFNFIGHDEGDVDINGVTIKLWHGEDGSSYAFSYRIQKIVEAFTGGEKPNVLLCGHTHKALSVFDRHIHCVSLGSIQRQSKWMRSKRAAAHTGFYVIKMAINDNGVAWFEPRFYPFYV